MDERSLREKAIIMYENGLPAKDVYQTLKRSEAWFYKWLKRYRMEGKDWAESRSRRPHNIPNKVDPAVEQTVVEIRKELENQPYAHIGALNIYWHLEQKGIEPPSVPTISRIIKRNNLVRKRKSYEPKGINYPAIKAKHSNYVHQFDILGPRYLSNDGRFYSFNIIDAYDRRCSINPRRRQTRVDAIKSLIRCWQSMGRPVYLQMDNMQQMRNSARHPRAISLFIRFCLKMGVQPVFIPLNEPWRNGIIERFQNVFDKMFFRARSYEGFRHLSESANIFESFHNRNHRYSTLNGKTPYEKCSGSSRLLPKAFKLPEKLEISTGYIHLIRFIRSNRILDIFGERYEMPSCVEYEYVKATINTKAETLSVYHDSEPIMKYKYTLPNTVRELTKIEW